MLPSLGEEGVQTCAVRDLVAEGASAAVEADPRRCAPQGVGREGAVDRYVAMTRATQQLIILTTS